MRIRTAGPASYCSVEIETFAPKTFGELVKVGSGTGFFYRVGSEVLLVTNWHVLTGRHPDDHGQLLDGYPMSPTHLQLHMALASNPKHFMPGAMMPLYDGNKPCWLEGPEGSAVDLAAIRMKFDADVHFKCVQDFAPSDSTALQPGRDVVIIGFPFGRNKTNPFPIWKRAMVASEPAYTIGGRLFTYLDTPGRPGMSGSPVYFAAPGFAVSREAAEAFRRPEKVDILGMLNSEQLKDSTIALEFAGVYSGSYGDQALDRLNLGRFWPVAVFDRMLSRGIPGANNYPPVTPEEAGDEGPH